MAQLTHQQYDLLERAITEKRRIAVMRRGTEYVVIPARLSVERGREAIQAHHPSGNVMTFYIDEVQSIEVVK
jgi:predicted DNA-binding transcriptional regulator YafY